MDLHDLAQLIGPKSDTGGLRLRQGTVQGVNANGTLSVTIGGSSTIVNNVKALASVCPKYGASVWLASDGRDLFAVGTMTPVGPAYASVLRTTDQSIANDTDVYVNFLASATVEADTHGMFSTAAPDRLTVQVPGVYLLSASVAFGQQATGYRHLQIEIDAVRLIVQRTSAFAGVYGMLSAAGTARLAVGQIIQLAVRHTYGSALACSAGVFGPRLQATWLRPVTS